MTKSGAKPAGRPWPKADRPLLGSYRERQVSSNVEGRMPRMRILLRLRKRGIIKPPRIKHLRHLDVE